MTSLTKKPAEYLIICGLMLCSALIGILSVMDMPLFSDAAFHASVIQAVTKTGSFPTYSPVGWTNYSTHPLSHPPFLTHPPLFYLLNAALTVFDLDIVTVLSILSILPTVLSVYYIYKLSSSFFTSRIAILTSILFVFMPMNIWLISHRITEPLQFFLTLAGVYYLHSYTKTKQVTFLALGALFLTATLYIKITSLFIAVTVVLYLILSRIKLKSLLIFGTIMFVLYLPCVAFSVSTRGTISYAPPGLPLIDKYLFNPWWKWEKSSIEKELAKDSNQESLRLAVDNYDRVKRSFIQDDLKDHRYINALQKFTIFAISDLANEHWFSPNIFYTGFYLFLFGYGGLLYWFRYRITNFHLLILPLFLVTSFYLTKVAELRYFYILNILLIVIYALALDDILRQERLKILKIVTIAFLIISLIDITYEELIHSWAYKHSIAHNLMPQNAGVMELNRLQTSLTIAPDETIFTHANSEVSYYLNRRTVWDYRLLFVPEERIDKYLDAYNVKYFILPNYLLKDTVYSVHANGPVENIMKNWEGTSIPLDSPFYRYLTNQSKVEALDALVSVRVYRRKI